MEVNVESITVDSGAVIVGGSGGGGGGGGSREDSATRNRRAGGGGGGGAGLPSGSGGEVEGETRRNEFSMVKMDLMDLKQRWQWWNGFR